MLELITAVLGQFLGGLVGAGFEGAAAEAKLRRALAGAVARAEARFRAEHGARDPELVAALLARPRLADTPAVRDALSDLLARPHLSREQHMATLRRSFADVLPEEADRARVDAAVAAFLSCLGDEVLGITQLQPLYTLLFQKAGAERLARVEARLDELDRPAEGAAPQQPAARPALGAPPVRHNLPRPDYGRFIGREEALGWITERLDDPAGPQLVAIVGIGGLGKSALAIAVGHAYNTRGRVAPGPRFDAIIWLSAKETALTAEGPASAAPPGLVFNDLAAVYAAIAQVLDLPGLKAAPLAEQSRLVQAALAAQPGLLIIDNYETINDPQVDAFLRALPPSTRALITSRTARDDWRSLGQVLPLGALEPAEALALIDSEAAARGLSLDPAQRSRLAELAGGLPLPIKLCLARLDGGEPFAYLAGWIGAATGDMPDYCVRGQIELARSLNPMAWRMLLACACFEQRAGAPRAALDQIAGALGAEGDAALSRLRKLSLINLDRHGRLWMLPIVQRYALAALESETVGPELRAAWLAWARDFAREVGAPLDLQIEQAPMAIAEYPALRLAIDWCQQSGRHGELIELVEGCWFIAELLGRFDELESMMVAAQAAAEAVGDERARALALRQQAWAQRIRGESLATMEAEIAQAEALAAAAGDQRLQADIWYVGADLAMQRGDLAGARALALRIVDLGEQSADARLRSLGAYRMAKVALGGEGPAAALDWLEQAEQAAAALGWRRQLAWVAYRRGITLNAAGRFAEAEAALRQSLSEARVWGEARFVAYGMQRLVEVYANQGLHAQAWPLAEEVRAQFDRLAIERPQFTALHRRLQATRLLNDLLAEPA